MTTVVKVCGIRTLEEGRVALASGADWLGFVFFAPSKRNMLERDAAVLVEALRAEFGTTWQAVGVFVDPQPAEADRIARSCALDRVQLSGHEAPETVQRISAPTLKAIHVAPGEESRSAEAILANAYGADLYLLDTQVQGYYGGTGQRFDWAPLREVGSRCLIAGGLRPDNVASALEALAPLGIDVSSGVEYPQGGKDPELVRAFLAAVRTHERRYVHGIPG